MLDAAPAPVDFFFRDDDAGWEFDRLVALLDTFERNDVPLDLAVIPAAVDAQLARELAARAPEVVGLHQHGYNHHNHEPAGRKCEFGESRSRADQQRDIGEGWRLLAGQFGDRLDAIFTPPWNRCTAATAESLVALGFKALSRDRGATPLALGGLGEIPVAVDWCKRVDGLLRESPALAQEIVAKAQQAQPVGIMLHHGVMDEADRQRLGELLSLLQQHPASRCRPMRELVQ
jgi:peptidoglycan/xylan/chitin deacetylase (PgdA/CDA1 family)